MSRKKDRRQRHAERPVSAGRRAPNVLMPGAGGADDLFARAASAYQSDRSPEAAALLQQVLNQDPRHAAAHNLLGILRHRQGENTEAAAHLRTAVELRPDVAENHCNLGIVELALGETEAAERDLEKAATLNPRLALAHFHLGLAYAQDRKWNKAVAALQRVIALVPDDAAAKLELGRVLVSAGRGAEAVAHFQKLRQLFPGKREVRYGLAAAYESAGRIADAAKELRDTVTEIPGLLDAVDKLGVYAANMGRFDEAKTFFDAALAFYPDSPDLLYDAATNTKALSNAEGIARIETVLSKETHEPRRALLHFALGKIHDDRGAYAEAFANFKAANDIADRSQAYDADAWTAYTDRIIATFTPAYFAARQGFGSKSIKPIFIFGMPRSGTTLVERIIAAHPEVAAGGEPVFLRGLTDALPERLGVAKSYPECAAAVDEAAAADLARAYLDFLDSWAPGADRVTDKVPANYYHLGLLAVMFPKATYVHVRRDPVDTCLSCYVTNLRHGYSHDLVKLGRHYRDYARLMAHWRKVLPVPFLEVDYEDLVRDQEGVSRRLVAHCALPWDGRCLDFHKGEGAVRTASIWQVRQPMYKSSVGRWRSYEPFLKPLIETLKE